ncbi:MAG: uracil-DNA glycosylase [Clostridiales bacterium]|jgi:uracil-DNA glycosylase|nr:uracil-DNA glycosylase [Clostridiales bacterium]
MNTWYDFLKEELESDEFKALIRNVKNEYNNKIIYPKYKDIFKAFKLCNIDDVKVVIIGQDPYHGENEATGLAFSVEDNIKTPPSLRNIFIELNDDLKINKTNNSLDNWAKQGVFLINSVLTVEKDKPGSHKFLNWERFTDYVIKVISDKKENIVFILLGNYARSKKPLIDEKKHLIIETTHPSPFSVHRGFFGSKIFSRTNNYLKEKNKNTIDFSL